MPIDLQVEERAVDSAVDERIDPLKLHDAQLRPSESRDIVDDLISKADFILFAPSGLREDRIGGEKADLYELPTLPILSVCISCCPWESEGK